MLWPNICVDNFFDDPEKVVELANSLSYEPCAEGRFPGVRSKPVHQINYSFFDSTCIKILSLLYPNDAKNIQYTADMFFQKIDSKKHTKEGWVHYDTCELSSIIYLSKNSNAGTSIYQRKGFQHFPINSKVKNEFYKKEKTQDDETYEKALKENNNLYEKTISYKSIFNRLIALDAASLHGVDSFGKGDERLILVTFFQTLNFTNGKQLKFPISEKNRI